ncbi:MAG: endonuclease III [Lachnospiraceae bacterium]|jgi:endonuclease-3
MNGEMTEKERVNKIIELLNEHYGNEQVRYLDYTDAWELLVATILSAQCTDARVNLVTKELFARYTSVEELAAADIKELERIIFSTGFYRNKAKNIKACAEKLVTEFGGIVPSGIEELTSLPGVGRKTANVVRGYVFGIPGVVVDTHVGRISGKLGLTAHTDPEKIERDLERVLPRKHWILWNIQIIRHGREICVARRPRCGSCFLAQLCPGREEDR